MTTLPFDVYTESILEVVRDGGIPSKGAARHIAGKTGFSVVLVRRYLRSIIAHDLAWLGRSGVHLTAHGRALTRPRPW